MHKTITGSDIAQLVLGTLRLEESIRIKKWILLYNLAASKGHVNQCKSVCDTRWYLSFSVILIPTSLLISTASAHHHTPLMFCCIDIVNSLILYVATVHISY